MIVYNFLNGLEISLKVREEAARSIISYVANLLTLVYDYEELKEGKTSDLL